MQQVKVISKGSTYQQLRYNFIRYLLQYNRLWYSILVTSTWFYSTLDGPTVMRLTQSAFRFFSSLSLSHLLTTTLGFRRTLKFGRVRYNLSKPFQYKKPFQIGIKSSSSCKNQQNGKSPGFKRLMKATSSSSRSSCSPRLIWNVDPMAYRLRLPFSCSPPTSFWVSRDGGEGCMYNQAIQYSHVFLSIPLHHLAIPNPSSLKCPS